MKLPKSIVLTALIKLNMAAMGSRRPAVEGRLTLRLSAPEGVPLWRDGSDPEGTAGDRAPAGRGSQRNGAAAPSDPLCPLQRQLCYFGNGSSVSCGSTNLRHRESRVSRGGSRRGRREALVKLHLTKAVLTSPFLKSVSLAPHRSPARREKPGRQVWVHIPGQPQGLEGP